MKEKKRTICKRTRHFIPLIPIENNLNGIQIAHRTDELSIFFMRIALIKN